MNTLFTRSIHFALPLLMVATAGLLNGCLGSSDSTTAANAVRTSPSAVQAAQVEMGEQTIALRNANGRVEVLKNPLRIRFFNAADELVLEQVSSSGGVFEPGFAVDEPLGSDYLPRMLLNAPFSYMVGAEIVPQLRATPWVGNYLTQALVGLQYHGTEVLEANKTATGVALTIATNDPTGRVIDVEIAPADNNSFEVRMAVKPASGVVMVADSFVLQQEESFYGFGGRHNAVNQRGNLLTNFIQAQNIGAGPLAPVANLASGQGEGYMFPSGPDAAYYISTAFASTGGYGFMLDSTRPSRYDLGASNTDAWQVNVSGSEMIYLLVPGTEKKALQGLSGLQGRHRVPMQADLGPTLSRAVRVLSAEADDATSYEAKIWDDIAQIDAFKLPVKGYVFEGWEILPRETSKTVIKALHDRNIRAYLYIRNYVGLDVANTERPETFTEALQEGYVVNDAAGLPYLFGTPFGGLGAAIDFTNPEAVAWWEGRIREMLEELGADGFMQDFGEHIALDMHFFDGSTGATMHNHYPTVFHQTTRKIIDDIESKTGRHIFFWTRAGYSGRQGSSGFESSNFPGDETSDWSRASGIASLTTDMLSRGATGSYGYNTDIGGYFDFHTGPASAELYTRWSFWAALSPVFRVHNSSSNGVRMPWFYGEETLQHWRKAAELHLKAAPLIIKLWQEAQTTGVPPVRGLWVEYPKDERARQEDQQWMLGPDVLVAPVVEQGASTRDVYLPKGCWKHVDTGVQYEGPRDVTVPAPIDSLPYFFRCGSNPF
ncbi:TIM-barrel domain-containing protein [uncultured Limnobacter sp.]|uniref:TIM-barrel domain-containing protein n=1 Tax=uncultured Limnobacter sp. TaxID=199681 RepID=UPI0030F84C89